LVAHSRPACLFDATRQTHPPDCTLAPTKATACITANARCLAACPRGDSDANADADAGFLCTNRCRTRLQACKGQAGKPAANIE
jgi:hypothetical protein